LNSLRQQSTESPAVGTGMPTERSLEFVAVVKLNGGADMQSVSLEPADFKTIDGEAMSSWKNVDLLSVRAYYENSGTLLGSKNWAGRQPKLRKLCWRGADGLSP